MLSVVPSFFFTATSRESGPMPAAGGSGGCILRVSVSPCGLTSFVTDVEAISGRVSYVHDGASLV